MSDTQINGTTGEDLAIAARRRRLVVWIVVSILAVGGGFASIAYKPWRLRSLHRASRTAIEKGDYRTAAFMARRALQIDPDCVSACVTMAEAGEHDHVPDAVFWRKQVLRLVGESTDTLVGLASTALSFGKISTARSALLRVPEKDHGREDFLVLSGAIALEERKYVESARFYEAAIRLNPGKAEYRFALGRAKCASDDYLTREEGRRLLLELGTHKTLGAAAFRAVIDNCEAQQEYQAALRHAQQLVALPTHKFLDEVLRLRLMRKTEDKNFATELADAEHRARDNLRHVGILLLWMSMDGLAREGLDWVLKRESKLGRSPEILPAIANCYLTLTDWSALLAITQNGNWNAVEYVRHAYRARAYKERSEISLARNEWDLATNAATRQIEALTWLAQMASAWKWGDKMEKCLWALLNEAPGSQWAIEALKKSYLEQNHTAGLRQIALHVVKTDPADENAQNDLALVSLLLNMETDRAMKIARDLYTKHPGNPAFNSTYAFALHSSGHTEDGLKVLENLSPQSLEVPTIAAYYGIMLAAYNSPDKASHFLDIGRQGILLREEKELIANAGQLILESKK